ncbi:uncharacterized protein LOC134687932 [Mytilus trossulus]|uniref:uncharacterized protein LOC134687932 n=1 Tax=Mytilus trossulus TaxID=6551 RepID=UPI0030070CC0
MLVDTGSVYTLISEALWETLRSNLCTSDRYRCAAGSSTIVPSTLELVREQHKVVSANGEPIDILGKTQLSICIGQEVGRQSVLVARDLAQECILGVDFMRAHKLIIDFDTMALKSKTTNICLKKGNANLACNIKCAKKEVIPAGHEKIIDGKLVAKGRGEVMTTNYVGIIESKLRQTNEKPVLLARSLVMSKKLTVPLRVANFSSEDVTIYKNTTLGIFSTIDENFDKDKGVCGAVNSSTGCTGIRNTIDNMHVDCSLNLEQKGRLNSLLEEYSSIFSNGPADLGRTSLVKHHIETGSSCPLRQGVRRVPIHKQKEIKDHIDNMLQERIIQPS